MAKSDDSFLENIWDFILGSLRLILFIIIFTLTLISIIVTVFINLTLYYGHSQALEYVIFNSIVLIPLMVLVLGAHGFFYKNTTTLHWFSIILFVASVLTLITGITMFVLSETLNQGHIENQLRKAQKDYDWFKKPTDINSDSYIDTTFWDGLQSLFNCCGVDGPQDWAESGPKFNDSIPVYPRSCCSRPDVELPEAQLKLCNKDSVHQNGCRNAIKFSWKSLSIVLVVLAALYSLVAAISRLIIRETEQEEAEVRADAVAEALGEDISLSNY